MGEWEAVIGLEVHTELRTATKLFCGCPNAFGVEPNTSVCPVCLGLPGSLPVLNAKAVELAITVGLALSSRIQPSQFHRKNYFYPDMPKDYQISQYDVPVNAGGAVALRSGKVVGIVRAHLEEDTGKLVHRGGGGRIGGAEYSLIDYNRSGVPLLEIVSEPEISSAEEAKEYVSELRAILVATGASDGRMEEGSLRVDANVSVRPSGSAELRTRVEIKNVNSLRSLGRAIGYEIERQIAVYEGGGSILQQTRHFDEASGETLPLRAKEEANDYRYFPEPDLPPISPLPAEVERIASELPLLPAGRRSRLFHLVEEASPDQVEVAITEEVWPYVATGVDFGVAPELVLARAANELVALIGDAGLLTPLRFAEVVALEERFSPSQVKLLLKGAVGFDGTVEELVARVGLSSSGADDVRAMVKEVVEANPEEWGRFVAGDAKVAGFLLGQVMRKFGKAISGAQARAALDELASGAAGE